MKYALFFALLVFVEIELILWEQRKQQNEDPDTGAIVYFGILQDAIKVLPWSLGFTAIVALATWLFTNFFSR
ncbi:MAG: hypothetical protein AAB511_04115 [Patescibacteria group bacterium]